MSTLTAEPALPVPVLQAGLSARVEPVLTVASTGPRLAVRQPSDDRLPDTGVRDEYRTSGQWLAQPGEVR